MLYNDSIYEGIVFSVRVLFIGDVFGPCGVDVLQKKLGSLSSRLRADFCVVNGENAFGRGNGITREEAEAIRFAGADVITGGNHSFHKSGADALHEGCEYLLRPANLIKPSAGQGFLLSKTAEGTVLTVSLIGTTVTSPYETEVENPFICIDRIIRENPADEIFVDFHTEATSEKRAMSFFLDGRVSALVGTHTHVQTADAQVMEKGTFYVTDLGMTGPQRSVIGVEPEIIIARFLGDTTQRFEASSSGPALCGAFFDTKTKEFLTIREEC